MWLIFGYVSGEFSFDMQNIMNEYKLPKVFCDTFVGLLKKHFPGANIPLIQPIPQCDTVKSLKDKYNIQHLPYTTFDGCINGCTIYNNDFGDDLFCKECQQPRYYPCSQKYCAQKLNIECTHVNRRPCNQLTYVYLVTTILVCIVV